MRPPCFLCCTDDPDISRSLTADQLLLIWRLSSVVLPRNCVELLRSVEIIHLFRCRSCGFQFFDPQLAGDAEFYAAVQDQMTGYYTPNRPENERNARFAHEQRFHNILDVGCGTGFALDAARARGLQTFGVEFNKQAAAEARSRGHTIFSTSLESLEPQWAHAFDLISLNQLIEHVPNPVELITHCLALLKPQGVIAIAVPHSRGVLRFQPWLASNWPPHHLSHWRHEDLTNLGERSAMRVIRRGGNQLLGRDLETVLLANRTDCLALGKKYRGPGVTLTKLLAFAYRKTGLKHFFPSQGHSIFCYLQRITAEPSQ